LHDDLIAQFPPAVRGAAACCTSRHPARCTTAGLASCDAAAPDDLLVLNDTRVIKARLFGTKDSGAGGAAGGASAG